MNLHWAVLEVSVVRFTQLKNNYGCKISSSVWRRWACLKLPADWLTQRGWNLYDQSPSDRCILSRAQISMAKKSIATCKSWICNLTILHESNFRFQIPVSRSRFYRATDLGRGSQACDRPFRSNWTCSTWISLPYVFCKSPWLSKAWNTPCTSLSEFQCCTRM